MLVKLWRSLKKRHAGCADRIRTKFTNIYCWVLTSNDAHARPQLGSWVSLSSVSVDRRRMQEELNEHWQVMDGVMEISHSRSDRKIVVAAATKMYFDVFKTLNRPVKRSVNRSAASRWSVDLRPRRFSCLWQYLPKATDSQPQSIDLLGRGKREEYSVLSVRQVQHPPAKLQIASVISYSIYCEACFHL